MLYKYFTILHLSADDCAVWTDIITEKCQHSVWYHSLSFIISDKSHVLPTFRLLPSQAQHKSVFYFTNQEDCNFEPSIKALTLSCIDRVVPRVHRTLTKYHQPPVAPTTEHPTLGAGLENIKLISKFGSEATSGLILTFIVSTRLKTSCYLRSPNVENVREAADCSNVCIIRLVFVLMSTSWYCSPDAFVSNVEENIVINNSWFLILGS